MYNRLQFNICDLGDVVLQNEDIDRVDRLIALNITGQSHVQLSILGDHLAHEGTAGWGAGGYPEEIVFSLGAILVLVLARSVQIERLPSHATDYAPAYFW